MTTLYKMSHTFVLPLQESLDTYNQIKILFVIIIFVPFQTKYR